MSRIYFQTDHRARVRGMGKEELVSKVQYFARVNLGLDITKKFLRRFSVLHLYDALWAAQQGKGKFDIFRTWKDQKRVVQEILPF